MSNDFLMPTEINIYAQEAALKKAKQTNLKLFLLACLGGIYISFGGMLATLAAIGSLGVLPYGLVKILMGVSFSLGLILIVIAGGELFTGSTAVFLAFINKEISLVKVFKNWSIVYLGNFLGSLLIVLLVFLSGYYNGANGLIGKTIFTIASTKMHYSFLQALILGIFCNIFVCLAIWLSYAAKQISGKILAIIFPITAFIALGFEHCVANMYLVPIALVIKYFDLGFVNLQNIDIVNLSLSNFLVSNLLPVTVGNILGGLSIWLIYRFIYKN